MSWHVLPVHASKVSRVEGFCSIFLQLIFFTKEQVDKSAMTNWQQARSYQLHIVVDRDARIAVGKLGLNVFPRGLYIYTGSAERNMETRVMRHLSQSKKLRWHIDYLLNHEAVRIAFVEVFPDPECELNKSVDGVVLVPRFGASDCRENCGSHLKYLGRIGRD